MLDRWNIEKARKKYAYLISQDSLWDDMDATRRDIRVEVTKVTMGREDVTKLYKNVQKLRSRKKRTETSGGWPNEHRDERMSENER